MQNTIVSPVITIQNSPLSTATTNNVVPPPAHSSVSPVVLDLSLKSNMNVSNSSTDFVSYNIQPEVPIEYQMSVDDQFMDETAPLDLSINANSHQMDSMTSLSEQQPKDMFSETQCIVVDDGQDDDFIRRLIETSDFDLGLDQLPDGNNDNRSFKAALDMPLLETVGEDGVGKGNVVSKGKFLL